MALAQGFEERLRERKVRRRTFHLIFAIFALITAAFLIWKLSSLVLPIVVGVLLAFLFRPVKDRLKIPWLPHGFCRDWSRPILRFRGGAQTCSRRQTEGRTQECV
jgi:hypothetical protein